MRTSFAKSTLLKLKKYKQSVTLLDVGCNLDIFVKEARVIGFDAYGIDPCYQAIEEGKRIFNLKKYLIGWELTTINFPENSFDVVTLIRCLEHINDLNFVLKKVHFILKEDSIILIEASNFDSFWRKLLSQRRYVLSPKQHFW